MAFTVEQKINIAKICQYLCAADIRNGGLYGAKINPNLPQILYIERKSVEWAYNQNPNDPRLIGTSNYLYSLCNNALKAAQILNIGGGGEIVQPPNQDNSPYLIPITSADFTDATNYDNPYIVGKNLAIFWNDVPKYIQSPDEWVSTATGINIVIDGFDSTQYDYTLYIYIIDP